MLWYVNNHQDEFDNTHVYFATHNIQGIRSYPVPSGNLTRRAFIKIFPFDNELCVQTCTSTQISNMMASTYYRYSQESDIVYSGSYTKAITISFIADSSYSNRRYQTSYIKYDVTAKQAFEIYLRTMKQLGVAI